MALDWNQLINSAITSSINGVALFLSVRYMGKLVDAIERKNGKKG